jgi:cytidine deaminase
MFIIDNTLLKKRHFPCGRCRFFVVVFAKKDASSIIFSQNGKIEAKAKIGDCKKSDCQEGW